MFRRKMLPFLLILCLCPYLYLQAKVIWHPYTGVTLPTADCIVILGHSLDDAGLPGYWLVRRLEEGFRLHQDGFAPAIIVTGGQGPGDPMPVAQSMKDWLVNKGVDPALIYMDAHSFNTYENFKFARDITVANHWHSLIVVTNDFHIFRSMYISKHFFEEVYGYSADIPMSFQKALAYGKEPLALIKFALGFNHSYHYISYGLASFFSPQAHLGRFYTLQE